MFSDERLILSNSCQHAAGVWFHPKPNPTCAIFFRMILTRLRAVLPDAHAGLRTDFVGNSAAEGVRFKPFKTIDYQSLTCTLFQRHVILEPLKFEILGRLGKHIDKKDGLEGRMPSCGGV